MRTPRHALTHTRVTRVLSVIVVAAAAPRDPFGDHRVAFSSGIGSRERPSIRDALHGDTVLPERDTLRSVEELRNMEHAARR